MTTITIEGCVYKVHPIYDLYAGSEDGYVINTIKKVPHVGNKTHSGYLKCMVRKYAQSGQKTYFVHRFIWECFNGVVPEGKVIDHINNEKKDDNQLCNLQLLTHKQNCKKSAKDRDYTFVAKNCENRKCVKATNKNTNEVSYYNSMYAVQQHLGINAGIVKMVCGGLNKCKSGTSKKDGHSYTFEYVKDDDLPDNYKKSANIRPKRVSEKDKKKRQREWWKKEYICPKCSKVMKYLNHFHIFLKSFIGIQLLKSSLYPFHLTKACFFL